MSVRHALFVGYDNKFNNEIYTNQSSVTRMQINYTLMGFYIKIFL